MTTPPKLLALKNCVEYKDDVCDACYYLNDYLKLFQISFGLFYYKILGKPDYKLPEHRVFNPAESEHKFCDCKRLGLRIYLLTSWNSFTKRKMDFVTRASMKRASTNKVARSQSGRPKKSGRRFATTRVHNRKSKCFIA